MKKKPGKWLLGAAITFCLLGRGDGALAHLPNVLEAGELYTVSDPLLSFALYGDVQSADDFFEVSMDLEKPLAIPIEILVPRVGALANHRPAFAIIGKGLPTPSAEDLAFLPRAPDPGLGAVVVRNDDPDREVIFESFTRRVLLTNGVAAYVLPAGNVRFWIWSPQKTLGRFIFGFGVEEGSQDFGDLFSNWGDYAY
jgi:hypothetical protein